MHVSDSCKQCAGRARQTYVRTRGWGPGLFTLKRQSRRKVTSGARALTGALPTSVTFAGKCFRIFLVDLSVEG